MLMRFRHRQPGFTMIELLVSMAVFAILVALAVPTMSQWIASSKVRAVADSLQNGIRLAQTESMRRSRQVVFALTNNVPAAPTYSFTASTNGNYWAVQTNPALAGSGEVPVFLGSGVLTSQGSPVQIAGPAEICFNSVGRLVANPNTSVPGGVCQPANAANVVGLGPVYTYAVTLTSGSNTYTYNVNVAVGGQVRICDPSQTLSDTNSYGC